MAKLNIRRLLDKAKKNRNSQKTKNNLQLLTQQGGITPQASAMKLVTKRSQLDRYIDSLLFG